MEHAYQQEFSTNSIGANAIQTTNYTLKEHEN